MFLVPNLVPKKNDYFLFEILYTLQKNNKNTLFFYKIKNPPPHKNCLSDLMSFFNNIRGGARGGGILFWLQKFANLAPKSPLHRQATLVRKIKTNMSEVLILKVLC